MPSRRLHDGIFAEDERSRVIGLDDPLRERLVAHLVESSEHDDDVGERHITEGGELGECREPRHARVRRPTDDIVGEQGAKINRFTTDLSLDRLHQHILTRSTHHSYLPSASVDPANVF